VLVVTFDGQTFSFAFDIADPAQFSALLREILDWRMAQYLSRTGTAERTEDVICRVSQNSTGNLILFLPSKDTGGSLPQGPLIIEVDGRTMEEVIAKIAINVVRNPGEAGNQLSAILRFWFGDGAGLPGRGERVRLRRDVNVTTMEPFFGTTRFRHPVCSYGSVINVRPSHRRSDSRSAKPFGTSGSSLSRRTSFSS